MLFDQDFAKKLQLKEQTLLVASIRPENKSQIDEGFHYLSSESIRNRFMGSKKEFTSQELRYLTELDGINHYALGVLERAHAKRGIAIARMVRSSEDPTEAEVAITIIDEYQRRGLGSILLNLLILAGQERGIQKLSFTYFHENSGIERLIHKTGKNLQEEASGETKHVLMDISLIDQAEIKSRLATSLPQI